MAVLQLSALYFICRDLQLDRSTHKWTQGRPVTQYIHATWEKQLNKDTYGIGHYEYIWLKTIDTLKLHGSSRGFISPTLRHRSPKMPAPVDHGQQHGVEAVPHLLLRLRSLYPIASRLVGSFPSLP